MELARFILTALLAVPATLVVVPEAHSQSLTHSGKQCRVKSDLDAKVAKPIASRVDRYCDHFEQFYDGLGLEPRNNNKVVLRVFASYDEFEEFHKRTTSASSTPAAFFSPSLNGIVAYHDANDPYLRQVLFHETSHQYLNRYTSGAPKWANEGLAEYFEGWQLTPTGELVKKRPAFFDLLVVQKALADEKALALRKLVEMEPKVFQEFPKEYPELHPYLHYSTSWALVYYFLEGPNEDDRKTFVSFLEDLNKRSEQADPIAIDDWDALERRWKEFVLGLKIEAESADDHQILAANYREGSDWEKAIAEYRAVLEQEPKRLGIRYWLGYCLKRAGEYDEARAILAQADEEAPTDPRPPYMLARIESGIDLKKGEGDFEKALAHARRAVERTDDKNPFYLAFLAQCQHLAGDDKGAVKTLKRVLKLVSDEPEEVVAAYEKLLEEYGG